MADMHHWMNKLNNEVKSVKQLLQMSQWLSDVGKVSALSRAEKKLCAAQWIEKTYLSETRLTHNPGQRELYMNKLAQLSEELVECANNLNASLEALSSKHEFHLTGKDARDNVPRGIDAFQNKREKPSRIIENMPKELLRQTEEIQAIDEEADWNRADKLAKKYRKRRTRHPRRQ